MRQSKIIAPLLLLAIAIAGMLATPIHAEPVSDEQLEQIKLSCVSAKSNLRRLHTSDALLRVNVGQLYESISTKLMAPLGSRISLNRLGGIELISVTAEYDKELKNFRRLYSEYEISMSRTISIDCKSDPAAFYDSLIDTREKRAKVHESTILLKELLVNYRNEFEVFAGGLAL